MLLLLVLWITSSCQSGGGGSENAYIVKTIHLKIMETQYTLNIKLSRIPLVNHHDFMCFLALTPVCEFISIQSSLDVKWKQSPSVVLYPVMCHDILIKQLRSGLINFFPHKPQSLYIGLILCDVCIMQNVCIRCYHRTKVWGDHTATFRFYQQRVLFHLSWNVLFLPWLSWAVIFDATGNSQSHVSPPRWRHSIDSRRRGVHALTPPPPLTFYSALKWKLKWNTVLLGSQWAVEDFHTPDWSWKTLYLGWPSEWDAKEKSFSIVALHRMTHSSCARSRWEGNFPSFLLQRILSLHSFLVLTFPQHDYRPGNIYVLLLFPLLAQCQAHFNKK